MYRYADLFVISKNDVSNLFKNIPFLNGGLFDCLDKEDESDKQKVLYVDGFSRNPKKRAIIPDKLFFNEEPIEGDLSKYMEGAKNAKVRGLFNILNDYKFTVEENTPLDEEVALDPELLGNIFENLLAAYNPETASSARKATGSYYTPREIVDYMCDESIYYYLKTQLPPNIEEEIIREILNYSNEETHALSHLNDEIKKSIVEKLFKIKILDPACGSGAFLMGMLHKLVNILKKLNQDNTLWKKIIENDILNQHYEAIKKDKEKIQEISDDKIREEALKAAENRLKEIEKIFDKETQMDDYSRKLFIIENSIYGVDIQPIAVQITKLRFFLSLVIEQKLNNNNAEDNFGIRSLPNLELKIVAANTLLKLVDDPSLFRTDEVIKLEDKLKELMHNYFGAQTRGEKVKIQNEIKNVRKSIKDELNSIRYPSKVSEEIAQWNPFDQNQFVNWFDPEWMFGVRDGFDIVIGNPPYIQLQKTFDTKRKYADLYKDQKFQTFDRMGDIYCLFYEKGIEILKEKGILAYITSNKWMRAGYGELLRSFLIKYNPKILIDLGPEVFENATVDTNILILQKK